MRESMRTAREISVVFHSTVCAIWAIDGLISSSDLIGAEIVLTQGYSGTKRISMHTLLSRVQKGSWCGQKQTKIDQRP